MRSRKKEKVKTQLPHLWNPNKLKIKRNEGEIQNLIWVTLAGSLLCGGSVWLWLTGICTEKLLIRLLLTNALTIAVYNILTRALVMVALNTPI